MKTSKIFFLLALIVVAIIAAACSGNGGGDTTENNAVELSQTYTGTDMSGGSVTVNYPEGWFQDGDADAGITFTNVENVDAIASPADIQSGQMMTMVILAPAETTAMITGTEETTPAALITAFAAFMAEGEDFPALGEPQDITIDGQTGAIATGENEDLSLMMLVLPDASGAYVISMGVAKAGESDNLRPTFEAIAGSVEYTPAAGE